MSKPKYMEELLKIIFLWLGAAFAVTGLLCFISVLNPKASSMLQVSAILGMVFLCLGTAFFIVQTVLKRIVFLKNKLEHELLINGTKMNGTVEKVYLQKYTQYGTKSPYRILYTYTCQGKDYHHKNKSNDNRRETA